MKTAIASSVQTYTAADCSGQSFAVEQANQVQFTFVCSKHIHGHGNRARRRMREVRAEWLKLKFSENLRGVCSVEHNRGGSGLSPMKIASFLLAGFALLAVIALFVFGTGSASAQGRPYPGFRSTWSVSSCSPAVCYPYALSPYCTSVQWRPGPGRFGFTWSRFSRPAFRSSWRRR